MRSRKVIVTSRITSVAPLVRGRPDDNGKTTAYKAVAFLIPKKRVAAPVLEKRRKLKMVEKILFGRKPDKNIRVFPEREGIRRRLTPGEKDLFYDKRKTNRKYVKKRHQMRRRRKINLGRFSATLQIV